ncbi:hypothetical protein AGLY_004703 [Aphis glycines]|uniref:V-SNARE coiled-coil homology domain-containing protein n=1 Tax=Aphis glycines TaxID=307491 RepID=A0A6G0TUS5_APHGL|nr:hypothetical protein AGLY_004703 [Aphis glycines]
MGDSAARTTAGSGGGGVRTSKVPISRAPAAEKELDGVSALSASLETTCNRVATLHSARRAVVVFVARLARLRTAATTVVESLADGTGVGLTAGDDSVVGGPKTPQQIAAQKRLQQTQAQVDEVVDIMKTNVMKVLDRDQKLSELDDRADALQQGASQFEQQAGKLKRKFWLQNLKMMIIMGVIGLAILAIIVAWFSDE